MSDLLQILKFKRLSLELTDDEFDDFLFTLCREKGRDLISRLLCQPLRLSRWSKSQAPSLAADMLLITSIIIQKREAQQQQSMSLALDTLPNTCIGEIASNLDQNHYATLSRVNRSMYIGCNDPNRLLSASAKCKQISGELTLKVAKHPQIQQLSIINVIKQGNQRWGNKEFTNKLRICRRLQSLALTSFVYDRSWTATISQTDLQLPALTHLYLHCCSLPSPGIITHLFPKFNSVQHLSITHSSTAETVVTDTFPRHLISELFPNLNSLTVSQQSSDLIKFLLQNRGEELCQLDLSSQGIESLRNIRFTKLQRLRIQHHFTSDLKVAHHFVTTAPNLVSLSYSIGFLGSECDDLAKRNITSFITDILTKKRQLSDLYVKIWESEHLEFVCEAIDYGLHSTRKWKRKLMMVIGCTCNILKQMVLCDIKEYALFLQFRNRKEPDDNEDSLIKRMNDLMYGMGNVELIRTARNVFIIRDKGCKINCYKKWWMKMRYTSRGKEDRVIY